MVLVRERLYISQKKINTIVRDFRHPAIRVQAIKSLAEFNLLTKSLDDSVVVGRDAQPIHRLDRTMHTAGGSGNLVATRSETLNQIVEIPVVGFSLCNPHPLLSQTMGR